jgi:ankyrin repeat protein
LLPPPPQTFGPEVLFALRCHHGAYLRLCPDGSLRADGESPSDPSCVFVLQKGGVALHMRITARAANGMCVAWREDGRVAAGGAGATGGGGGARDCERWNCEPVSWLAWQAGAVPRNVYTFRTRGDAFLTASVDGEVLALPAGSCAAPAQLFWLVKPAEEQARLNAFRSSTTFGPAPTPVAPALHGGAGGGTAVAANPVRRSGADELFAAAKSGDVRLLQVMRADPQLRGAVNRADASGAFPLHHAVGGQHAEGVRELLEWGARTNVADKDGDTPLHVAALRGYWEIAEQLLASGANTAAKNADGALPLHHAASVGSARTVLLLVGRGAAIDAKNGEGETALHVAARCSRQKAAKALLLAAEAACAQLLDCRSAAGFTALHVAASEGHCNIATLLLDSGAAIDARGSNALAWTALHLAASCGHAAVVTLLLARGADMEAAGNKLETPRDVATSDAVRNLLLPKKRDDVVVAEREAAAAATAPATAAAPAALAEACAPAAAAALGITTEMLAAALATASAGIAAMHVKEAVTTAQPAAANAGAPAKQPAAPRVAPAAPAPAPAAAAKAPQAHAKPPVKGGGGAAPAAVAASKAHEKSKAAAAAKQEAAAPDASKIALRKTRMCRSWEADGTCRYGTNCHFAHSEAQMAEARRKLAKATSGNGAAAPPAQTAPVAKAPAAHGGAAGKAADAAPGGGADAFRPKPFPAFGAVPNAQFDGHGEKLAVAYMRWLGFADAATVGGIHTPDRGIDVRSCGALAQVKSNFRVASTSRKPLTQLVGDAAGLPGGSVKLLFFAAKDFSADAKSYAGQPGTLVHLFLMDISGGVEPIGAAANALVRTRSAAGGVAGGSGGGGSDKMAGWSREQVQAWMRANGLDAYADAFKPIIGAALVTLTDGDLQELGVNIAVHRRSILLRIATDSG